MPAIATPTEALKAELATQRQQGPDPVTPAPLEQIAQGAMGQRFTFAGAPDDGGRRSPASEGGAQARANEPTRPTLDLPRVQTDVERPERGTERRNLQRLVQGLGALGAVAGAVGDSTLMTAVGAGLAQGAGQAQTRSEQRYQQRLSSYEQFVRGARKANRQRRRAEAEAEYEAALADYKLDRQASQAEQQFERKKELEEMRAELDQPSETEKAVQRAKEDYYEAGATKRRAAAEAEEAQAGYYDRRPTTGGEGDLPSTPKDVERELATVKSQIQALRSRYQQVPTGRYGQPDQVRQRQVGQQIDNLIKRREALKARQARLQNGQSGGQQIPEEDLTENRETFMNQPAPVQGATAPGREGAGANANGNRPTAPADTPASQQDTRQRPTDVSDQVSGRMRRRVLQNIPEDDTTTYKGERYSTRQVALNAIPLVQSDTTTYTPEKFRQRFGFNPFQ
jgi:hypothetical protein